MIHAQKINYYIEKLKFLKTDCGKETVKIIDRQIKKMEEKYKDKLTENQENYHYERN